MGQLRFGIHFNKDLAVKYLNCLKNKNSFEPENEKSGWNRDELFMLISVLSHEIMYKFSKDKENSQIEEDPNDKFIQHGERWEVRWIVSVNSILCALRFGMDMIHGIKNGGYDNFFPPKHTTWFKPLGEQPQVEVHCLERKDYFKI